MRWRHVNYAQKLVLKVRDISLHRLKPRNIAMETSFGTVCMAVVLASITQCSGAIGPVIKCEPCDAGVRLLCKPLPKDCAESVREPGCGCCLTCALVLGQPCGVYTGRCGSGMTCLHQPGETKPLQALLEGRGVCTNSTNKRPVSAIPPINDIPESVDVQEEQRNFTAPPILQPPSSTRRPQGGPRLPQLPSVLNPAKADVLRRVQMKKAQSFKMEEVPGMLSTDQQNFSVESKQELEYGPCRREMESILNGLKITDILNPRGFRIPNCDKKGFYKKKQQPLATTGTQAVSNGQVTHGTDASSPEGGSVTSDRVSSFEAVPLQSPPAPPLSGLQPPP